MKVAVSIPNSAFTKAKLLAERLRTAPSEPYSRITEQMDRTIASVGEESDAFSQHAARRVLKHIDR